MHGWTHDAFTHYLAYPNSVQDSDNPNQTYWYMKFDDVLELDPEYHFTCVFYNVNSCRYCHGPNEHPN